MKEQESKRRKRERDSERERVSRREKPMIESNYLTTIRIISRSMII